MGFFMNYQPAESFMYISLTTAETYEVQYFVEIPSAYYYRSGFISAGNDTIVPVPRSLEATFYFDLNKGISISTNSSKVLVCGTHLSTSHFVAESYIALPIIKLDGDYVYYAISVSNGIRVSAILIVGTEDNTNVTFIVTQPADISFDNTITPLIAGRQYSLVMNQLQTAFIGSHDDLSGTKFSTDKPVSVLSGHECVNVPNNVSYCNYLIEQIPPVALWGKVYYTAPLVNKTSYTVKILAAHNSTNIFMYCNNRVEFYSLNEGNFFNRTLSSQKYCAIRSNKEILIVQFSHGGDEDNENGNPMMTLVPATNQYLNEIDVSTLRDPLSNYTHHINIIVMAQYYQPNMIYLKVGGVTRSLATEQWVQIQSNSITEAYATQVEIPEGVAEIFHTNPTARMSAIVYGFTDRYGSYGHIGRIRLPKGC